MALTRYIDDYQLSELEGVRFFMTEDGKTSIACRVSYEALQDLASHQQFEGRISDLFETYRPLIERVASATTTVIVRAMRSVSSWSPQRFSRDP